MRYSRSFLLRRFGLLLLIIWTAATVNFLIPHITPRNPLREKLLEQASRSGYIEEGFDEMVAAYEARFGLDQPLWKQYINYMGDMARFDLGYSISNYPKTVWALIAEGLPWTIGLLLTTTLIAFTAGSLIGALMVWPTSSKFSRYVLPAFLMFGAVPAYVVALALVYFFAFRLKILPTGGGYGLTTIPNMSIEFALEILKHSILPALALVLTQAGGWALGMRGMMVTVEGEDYMTFAEAKGLKDSRMFFRYGIRNALLPQVTGLALALSGIISGAVLVELVMGYPGLGTKLAQAIYQLDYFTIYGIVFFLIVSLGIAMFIIDLLYPLLDPRINYEKG
jgi:peptide/nickel transport system permease protein